MSVSTHTYLAMDFGASSGRAEIVRLTDGQITLEEIHRFENRPVRLNGRLYWDFPYLFGETLAALRICREQGIQIDSIGVDTWGVDFGLLDRAGRLVSNPVHYRDSRTEDIHLYSDSIVTRDKIFETTGCEPWAISSLFQLLAMQKENDPALDSAVHFLNMPDLFNYFLTGRRCSEKSIVSTGNLMTADGRWAIDLLKKFNLPNLFSELIEPGETVGYLQEAIQESTGLRGEIPVIAACGHDTAAVAAAVPAEAGGNDWAFISCGTWSILGALTDQPITQPDFLKAGFSNEYTLGGWFSCANITGLWIVQELRRQWNTAEVPCTFAQLEQEAKSSKYQGLIEVSDSRFMAPANMEETVREALIQNGEAVPKTRGDLVRCVYRSLAREYAAKLADLSQHTGRTFDRLYLVGGGAQSKLLCQFTADACGLTIDAGVDQCTALGNALTQAVALGHLADAEAARETVRNSFHLDRYRPDRPSSQEFTSQRINTPEGEYV